MKLDDLRDRAQLIIGALKSLFFNDHDRWLDYEKSRLPKGIVFPKGGQVWEAIDDCRVSVDHIFVAPGGGGISRATLAKGERVKISNYSDGIDRQGLIVSFKPVRYDDLHDHLVPEDIRNFSRYRAYALEVFTTYFNKHFRLIEEKSEQQSEHQP